MTSTDDDRIRGSVAAVLNATELVVNRGEADGVRRGMKFAVLNRLGIAIDDPATGEPLGSVEVAKVLVEAVRVEKRLTVCRTFKEIEVNSSFGFSQDLFGPSRRIRETLKAADNPAVEELDPEESFVAKGDPVVQMISGDEFTT